LHLEGPRPHHLRIIFSISFEAKAYFSLHSLYETRVF
jgi:hypothetical protein